MDSNDLKQAIEIGFVKINICEPERIDQYALDTKEYFNTLPKDTFNKFIALANIDDIEIRLSSAQLVAAQFSKHIEKILPPNYEAIAGVHLIKPFGIKGRLGLHFDCCLIDERIQPSFNLWIPLQNCNKWNGTISVVPYSHRINHFQRPFGLVDPFQNHYNAFKKLSKAIDVKKGEAILLHTGLMHGSGINLKFKPRVAVNYLIKPNNQSLVHFYKGIETPINKFEKYEVDDLFKTYDIKNRPPEQYKYLGLEEIAYENITKQYIKRMIYKLKDFQK